MVLDGEDLSAAWSGQPVVRKHPLFWGYGRNTTFKYPTGRDRSPNLAVREGPWKLLLTADGSGMELYDVIKDRSEEHDLAASEPELAKRLAGSAIRWWQSLPIANGRR
jgi:hypothetical protein